MVEVMPCQLPLVSNGPLALLFFLNNAHPSGGTAALAAAARDFTCYMRFLTSTDSERTRKTATSWPFFERTTLE